MKAISSRGIQNRTDDHSTEHIEPAGLAIIEIIASVVESIRRDPVGDRRQLVLFAAALFCCSALPACSRPSTNAISPTSIYPTSTLLPGTDAAMNSAGYWIGRHPAPDRVIMDGPTIAEFNRQIRLQGNMRNLAAFAPPTGKRLRRSITSDVEWILRKDLYRRDGRKVDSDVISPLMDRMNLDSIPLRPVSIRGFLTMTADLRVLPTEEPLFESPSDRYFDHLQTSTLEPGTPLCILHRSKDGKWTYVVSERVAGWLPTNLLVESDEETFLNRYRSARFVVVTSPKADLYTDSSMTDFFGTARMGTRLVLADPAPEASPISQNTAEAADSKLHSPFSVSMPGRNPDGSYRDITLWVDNEQVFFGFLPYTPRTIISQAFRMLNAPYGWGGMFGEQDCSQFMLELFSTVGIMLPRSARHQARSADPLPELEADTEDADKTRILLTDAVPGATLLGMPGHIMLYLGEANKAPYAIHATWAYRINRGGQDTVRLINRVAVTTLVLGEESEKGSYLRRLTTAVIVALPQSPED